MVTIKAVKLPMLEIALAGVQASLCAVGPHVQTGHTRAAVHSPDWEKLDRGTSDVHFPCLKRGSGLAWS